MEGGIFSRFDLLPATCQDRAVPRFRLLVAALACACLIAPTAAACGVALHLEWAEHHAEHHPPHDPTVPEARDRTVGATDHHLDRAPHAHAIPELAAEPAVAPGRDTRAVSHLAGAAHALASVREVVPPRVEPWRLRAIHRPDRPASGPDLVHLHCALLI